MIATELTVNFRSIAWTDETPYYVDTGEVISPEEYDEVARMPAVAAMSVKDMSDLSEILERRQDIESKIDAMERRRDIYVAHCNKMIGKERRKLDWWQRLYAPQVISFAKQWLAGGKDRTLTTPFGSVAFRNTRGKNKIANMTDAVEYVRNIDPSKIRVVESVTITTLKELVEVPGNLPFMRSTGPGESATIDTGYGG